jgi:hypothetical protein
LEIGKTLNPPTRAATNRSACLHLSAQSRRTSTATNCASQRAADRWGPLCITMTSPSSSSPFLPFADADAKARQRRGLRRDAPRGPPLHPCRPRALRHASPISSRATAPGPPKPSHLRGESSSVHTAAREGEEGEKEKRGRRSWRSFVGTPSPRRPEPLVGGAGPTFVERACFLYFHAAAPSSSSFSLTSRTALLHRRLHYGPWLPR